MLSGWGMISNEFTFEAEMMSNELCIWDGKIPWIETCLYNNDCYLKFKMAIIATAKKCHKSTSCM